MTIPVDNLYHWIESITSHPLILYVFQPHGSKDIFDLTLFKNTRYFRSFTPGVICHDQEPLDFNNHKFTYDPNRIEQVCEHWSFDQDDIDEILVVYSDLAEFPNLKTNYLKLITGYSDWSILLHSEKNSQDVLDFSQAGFIPVYYWSHAVIARDWYRFAEHDARLEQKNIEKTFLVYCRDWTPNREYRLKFLDLLVQGGLRDDCVISTQHVNNRGVHLRDYQVQDTRFLFDADRLLTIPDNTTSSTASAEYDITDLTSTAVSVVLETVVDTDKIHLTEKILRPIACGHAFLLAAGPGALAYLRSYGFRTFNAVFDESYDAETDCVKRLEMIVNAMQKIKHLNDHDWREIQKIVDHNKQHFFSKEFSNQIKQELAHNLDQAVEFCLANQGEFYWQSRKLLRRLGLINQWPSLKNDQSKKSIQHLRKHRSRRFQNSSIPVVRQ
jgi:hypothetical protein